MATVTIQVENNTVLRSLKRILSIMEGVTIIPSSRKKTEQDELNATTLKAIKEVKEGKTFKASSADDLLAQCLS